jgi:hypothetical protein
MRFARQRLRRTSSLVLGLWLFALLAGIANACLPGQSLDAHPVSHAAASTAAHHGEVDPSPDCAKLCNDGLPLFAKVQLVQDPPDSQAFLVARPVAHEQVVVAVSGATFQRARFPMDGPVYLRSLRLAL